jgi:hypothetical protein
MGLLVVETEVLFAMDGGSHGGMGTDSKAGGSKHEPTGVVFL